MSPLTRLCECHQRNCLTSVSGSSPATMAFAHVPSEGGNVDDPGDPGPEKFGDERDQVCNTLIKETAAVAFHKANADLAMRSAILARARVEQDELFVGDWCYYWKPQGHKLDPFRWRGPCLVVAVEVMPERTSTIYWIVHGSSLLRFTRSQLRHESVPERFERQGQPPHLEQLRMPMSTRLLKALKPARGPVRAVDVAEMGQDPFYYPGGYALSDAAGKSLDSFDDDKPLADKAAIDSTATNQNDIDMEPPEKEETFPIHAPTTIASTRSSPRPTRAEMPSPEKIDSRAAGVWTDTGPERPDAPAVTATSNPPAGDENDHAGKEGPQQAEHPTGIVERREQQPEVLPESFNRERRMYAAAPRVASQVSEERNQILDRLPPRRQGDGQPAPKQPRLEEVHMVEMTADDELYAVVESKLDAAAKQQFKEAKRKASLPWCENDAWRPVDRTSAPDGTIVPMRFLLRYKENPPHARVILQGFKHRDVPESKLDTESPTLSRLGKYLLTTLACTLRWKLGTMDVKSAFLQADYIHHKVDLYGEPSADMRRHRRCLGCRSTR